MDRLLARVCGECLVCTLVAAILVTLAVFMTLPLLGILFYDIIHIHAGWRPAVQLRDGPTNWGDDDGIDAK